AFRGQDSPAAALLQDILDAGLHQLSPLLDEVPGIGLHQRTRIADHPGLGPVDGTDQVLRQPWLAGTQPWCVEHVALDTETASVLMGLATRSSNTFRVRYSSSQPPLRTRSQAPAASIMGPWACWQRWISDAHSRTIRW